jgi:hypothetical protein
MPHWVFGLVFGPLADAQTVTHFATSPLKLEVPSCPGRGRHLWPFLEGTYLTKLNPDHSKRDNHPTFALCEAEGLPFEKCLEHVHAYY